MAKKSGKRKAPAKKQSRGWYKGIPKGKLNIRQSRFAQLLSQKAQLEITNGEAAVKAGYSPKNPDQSAGQALGAIRKKAPEILDEEGYSVRALIKNHLAPLLKATTIKVAQHEGEITDYVELPDNRMRLDTTVEMLDLHGAKPTEQEKQQGSMGIEVVVIDIARPDRSGVGVKVSATSPAPRKPEKPVNDDPRPRD